ncbi:Uncharacterised protein [Vibrio cholerae]|nr:Uncharacterised protein [Vibrio cholerae]
MQPFSITITRSTTSSIEVLWVIRISVSLGLSWLSCCLMCISERLSIALVGSSISKTGGRPRKARAIDTD